MGLEEIRKRKKQVVSRSSFEGKKKKGKKKKSAKRGFQALPHDGKKAKKKKKGGTIEISKLKLAETTGGKKAGGENACLDSGGGRGKNPCPIVCLQGRGEGGVAPLAPWKEREAGGVRTSTAKREGETFQKGFDERSRFCRGRKRGRGSLIRSSQAVPGGRGGKKGEKTPEYFSLKSAGGGRGN